MTRLLKVSSWPGRAAPNPYVARVIEAVEEADPAIVVADFSVRDVLLSPPQVLHIHWPESVFRNQNPAVAGVRWAGLLALIAWCAVRRIRLVATVHNVESHDQNFPRLERVLWNLLDRRWALAIHLSDAGRDAVLERRPRLATVRTRVIPLGTRPRPTSTTRADAKTRFGISPDTRVVAAAGILRAYKGIDSLVEAHADLEDDTILLVAGRCDDQGLASRLRARADVDDRLVLRLDHLDDDEFDLVLLAADLVVLPFTRILNSSTVLHALALRRPVLAPALGALSEVAAQVGGGWLHLFTPPLTSAVLGSQLDRAECPSAPPDLDWCSWELVGESTAVAYREAVS